MKIVSTERLSGIMSGLRYRINKPLEVNSMIAFLKSLEFHTEILKGMIYALEWTLTAPIDDINARFAECEAEYNKRLQK